MYKMNTVCLINDVTWETQEPNKWSVTQKHEVINSRDSGARWIKIAQDKGMSESTVRTIYAQKDEIRARSKPKTYVLIENC